MSETTNLDPNHDMRACPFGCGSEGKHNQSIYAWECGSNCLRLVADGSPIKGDLVRTQLCRLLEELTSLRARLEAAERHRDLYKRGAKLSGDLFCWCVENLSGFPPIDHDANEEIKLRLSRLVLAEEKAKRLEEAAKEAMKCADLAWTDISQWCQLATYQRMQSENASHDPLCATVEALDRSRLIRLRLGTSNAEIRALLAPAGEEGKDGN